MWREHHLFTKIYMASHPLYFAILFASNGISLIIGSQIVGRLAKRIPEQTLLLSGLWLAIIASVAALVVTRLMVHFSHW